jgi:hypothetical protein
MPEFEEPAADANQKINYTPSTDASDKPRTRRRSGGFKTEYVAPNSSIGEVNPKKALKSEKLSGGTKPEPKKKKPAPKAEKPEPRAAKAPKAAPQSTGNPQPSAETLAAIARVETRLNERKAERDAKRAERNKNRPAKAEKSDRKQSKPAGTGAQVKTPSENKAQSGGIVGSILKIFGLGPKEPTKKPSRSASQNDGRPKPYGGKGKSGGRPPAKGGHGRHRGQGGGKNQNRRGDQSGGGGKGRRRGGKGPRKSDRRTNETVS